MGFDDAESDAGTQSFKLTPKDLAEQGAPLAVNVVKFQNVSNLTVRFPSLITRFFGSQSVRRSL